MLLSRKITTGAMCAALTLVFAGLKYIFPVADLTFLTLTSFCIAISVILIDLKWGVLTYAVSALLISAFFSIFSASSFVLFFGIYPIVKAIIEKTFSRKTVFFVKTGIFVVISSVIALFFTKLIDINIFNIFERFPFLNYLHENRVFVFIVIFTGLLSVYDLVLSSLILFFTKKIQPNLRKFN